MALGADGRLRRDTDLLEMNAYCRRAVSKGVELARSTGGTCTVITMGPPSAEDVVREAVAHGADLGVLVSDSRLAGADTLATAQVLVRALRRLGPFDLVLAGRNAIDADTGQVGPEVAELLDLPFAAAVRELDLVETPGPGGHPVAVHVRCELDDGWRSLRVTLPAVLSTAERLISPCKMPPEARAAVPTDRVLHLNADDVGPGPWGQAASPTAVGASRTMEVDRERRRLQGTVEDQARAVVALLTERGLVPGADPALAGGGTSGPGPVTGGGACRRQRGASVEPVPDRASGLGPEAPVVAVVAEPRRELLTRELLGEAAVVAGAMGGSVLVAGPDLDDGPTMATWGADVALDVSGTAVEEDLARALAGEWEQHPPWAVLVPGTLWGREVAGRIAARLGAGLTGDAVGTRVEGGRLVCLKPAFSGRMVVDVTASSTVQMATVRPGMLPRREPRRESSLMLRRELRGGRADRVEVTGSGRDDDVAALTAAATVVSIGQGVEPDEHDRIAPLTDALEAELAATRKVTDRGWLPRARQVGITGHNVAPDLLVVIGASGSANHMVGTRGAGTVVAVNVDPDAPIFEWADIGMVADWHDAVPALVKLLT